VLIGRLNARIDMDLLEAIADAGFSLLLIGPHDRRWEPARFAALVARQGVRHVGWVPETEAPAYIAAADVGITPYRDIPFNRASFPLKTLDYLSAGRPAVSTRLPAAQWLLDDLAASKPGIPPGQILRVADDRAGFVGAVRQLAGEPGRPRHLRGDSEPAPAAWCRTFAARHSWSCRADALAAAIGLPL